VSNTIVPKGGVDGKLPTTGILNVLVLGIDTSLPVINKNVLLPDWKSKVFVASKVISKTLLLPSTNSILAEFGVIFTFFAIAILY